MTIFFTPLSDAINAPTSTGTATTVEKAQVVCVQNTNNTTAYEVTLEEADGTNIGTVHVPAQTIIFVHKGKEDKMFAANVAVKFSKASYPRG